jgi:intein/homing endonuclease
MAYVLGFFAADGYITVNKRGGQFWCFDIKERRLLNTIKKRINSNHKISVRKGSSGSLTYRLQIGRKEMCEDLRKLGFRERKTKSMIGPTVPKKYLADFTRGYFDGDGNVWVGLIHKERVNKTLAIRTVFTSGSSQFLEVLQQRLERVNIFNGVLSKAKGNYFRLTYSIHNSLRLYDFMYNKMTTFKTGLFLQRKKRIFERYIKLRKMQL